jgi:hypothetical protein
MNRVAERAVSFFPQSPGRTDLVLMPIDPHRMHAYWRIEPRDLEDARARLGDAGADARLILRLHDVSLIDFDGANAHDSFDLEVHGLDNGWYLSFWRSNRAYIAELGLRAERGDFASIVRSTHAELPPDGESEDYDRAGSIVDPATGLTVEIPDLTEMDHQSQAMPRPNPHTPPDQNESMVRLFYAALTRPPEVIAPETAPPLLRRRAGVRPIGGAIAGEGGHAASKSASSAPAFAKAPAARARDVAKAAMARGQPPVLPATARSPSPPATAPGSPATADRPDAAPAPSSYALIRHAGASGVGSSQSLGLAQADSEIELHAELRLHGRVRPGASLRLLGRPIVVRPDGSFSATWPLRPGAPVIGLAAHLIESNVEPREDD